MLDIVNFKRKSYHLDLENNSALISLSLSNHYFRAVVNDYNNSEKGLLALTYVVNIAHYGSPSNLIGLTGKERDEDVRENLGLDKDFIVTDKMKRAIVEFNKRYNKGVFGLFKELNRSFEMTRETVEIINISLKHLIANVKENQNQPVGDNASSILTQIKEINDAVTQVRNMTTSLSSDVESLKTIEGILLSEEASNVELYGGGSIPESAMVADD